MDGCPGRIAIQCSAGSMYGMVYGKLNLQQFFASVDWDIEGWT